MLFKLNPLLIIALIVVFITINMRVSFLMINNSDSLLRLNLDDAIINVFAFFWTNFWYIPLVFSTLLLYYSLDYKLKSKITLLVIVYLYEFFDLNTSNWSTRELNSLVLTNNVFLTNAINKYHPGLFYLSVVYFTLVVLIISTFKTKYLWNKQLCFFLIRTYTIFIILINLLALFLGSWWALQEGTWGGWWNWDASETFGLFLGLFCIKNLHSWNYTHINYQLFVLIKVFLFYFLTLYFLIQLNFDLISHNFGIKFFFFFNNSFFLIEGLIVSSLFFLKSLMNFLFIFKNTRKLIKTIHYLNRKLRTIWTLIFAAFVLSISLASFSSIFSYFLWSFLNINMFNGYGLQNLNKISIFSYLILLIMLRPRFLNPVICLTLFCNLNLLYAFLYLIKKQNVFIFSHFLITLFTLFNSYSGGIQISLSFLKSNYLPYELSQYCYWVFYTTLSLDENSVLTSYIVYPTYALTFINYFFIDSFTNLPLFKFVLTCQNMFGSLLTIGNSLFFSTQIEIPYLNYTSILFFIGLVVFFTYLCFTKKQFIF